MSDESASDKPRTEGQIIGDTVKQTIDYLRTGKVTRTEATDLNDASRRALNDMAIGRAIR